jgi:hypothetical protein
MRPHPRRPTALAAVARWTLTAFAALGILAAAHAQGEPPPLPDDVARIHYQRADGDVRRLDAPRLGGHDREVTWRTGLEMTGFDAYGAYWDVRFADGAARVGFIVHAETPRTLDPTCSSS